MTSAEGVAHIENAAAAWAARVVHTLMSLAAGKMVGTCNNLLNLLRNNAHMPLN
jgi:hypothetical protein